METIESIMSRKSIRKYEKNQISTTDLDTILDCAIKAPSAHNEQSWYFVALQKNEVIKNLEELAGKNFYGAPTVIICFTKDEGTNPEFDVAMAMENMMISANALSLGSCFVTWVKDLLNNPEYGEIKKSLGVPEGYHCVGSIVVGYATENPEAKPRKHDVISVIR